MAKGEGTMEAAMVKACVQGRGVGDARPCRSTVATATPRSTPSAGCSWMRWVLSIFEGADEVLCLRVIARRLIEQAGA